MVDGQGYTSLLYSELWYPKIFVAIQFCFPLNDKTKFHRVTLERLKTCLLFPLLTNISMHDDDHSYCLKVLFFSVPPSYGAEAREKSWGGEELKAKKSTARFLCKSPTPLPPKQNRGVKSFCPHALLDCWTVCVCNTSGCRIFKVALLDSTNHDTTSVLFTAPQSFKHFNTYTHTSCWVC